MTQPARNAREDYPLVHDKRYRTRNAATARQCREALAEIDRLRAKVARLAPVVEAAKAWRANSIDETTHDLENRLIAAVDALTPPVQPDSAREREEGGP